MDTLELDAPAPTDQRKGVLPLSASDVRGIARLTFDSIAGITDIVESMHHTIASVAPIVGRAQEGRTGGITGAVYRTVRGTARAVGFGVDMALGFAPSRAGQSSARREAWIAALNGVWGDHLEATGNPLAIQMSLRQGGKPLVPNATTATGRIVVLVHGLAMNDLQWERNGHDHGAALARDLGFTPVYLHYNSGRHISHNGQEFSRLLDQLVERWPVPIDELVIVGHSMGGLVARSACLVGSAKPWFAKLTRLAFLGTPHHGAPLERGGHVLDIGLGLSPYTAPLARLGTSRSAGITDLRHASILERDAQLDPKVDADRAKHPPAALPAGVDCYFVAATTALDASDWRSSVIGDGLVPVASALGQHQRKASRLAVPPSHRLVVTQANHWDLLDRADVYQKLRNWLE
jgi:pimeloyl-ACP methyl ester carboxylesterase